MSLIFGKNVSDLKKVIRWIFFGFCLFFFLYYSFFKTNLKYVQLNGSKNLFKTIKKLKNFNRNSWRYIASLIISLKIKEKCN